MKKTTEINFDSLPPFAQKQAMAKGAKFSARSGSYFGGSSTRRGVKGWLPPQGDADADTLTDRPKIVARSRDLVRNAPIATGAINTNVLNVVGSGLTMQSRINRHVLNIEAKEANRKQNQIESEWKLWANNMDCSYDRRSNFSDLTNLVLRGALESGDIFGLLPFEMRGNNPYGLKVQLIESDRVCNRDNTRNTNRLCAGVHMDERGAVTGYDIRTTHPNSEKSVERKWDTVQAFTPSGRRRVIHVYEQLRPDQTRGMPYLAPIIEILKQMSKYTNAEIAAAVINSYFTVFIKSADGSTPLSPYSNTEETSGNPEEQDYKLGAGAFVQLADGESVDFADPNRPNKNFEAFNMAMLRQIGAALSIPYELLNYQFSSSYSASRAAMLLAWKMFKTRRTWLVNHWCNLIYEAWFEEAVLRGRVDAAGFMEDAAIRAAYLECKWIGPAAGQLDPTKETTAALDRIGGRLSTISAESASIEEDFDQNVTQTAYEEEFMRENNVSYTGQGARNTNVSIIEDNVNEEKEVEVDEDIDVDEDDSDDEDPNNTAKGDR